MNIRPKNIPKFQYGGNTGIGRTTSDWYKYVHSKQALHILDTLSKYGEANDYGLWLNDMQHSHSQIYNAAGGANEAWKKKAYSNESVRKYQNDYLGNTNNLSTLINKDDYFNYNTLGIANAYNNNVFTAPGKRLSGDNPSLKYVADGLYSSVTDWRRLLGRRGDWDENSQEFKNWRLELNKRGWDTYFDNSDGYYKLKRLGNPNDLSDEEFARTLPGTTMRELEVVANKPLKRNPVTGGNAPVSHQDAYGFDWLKITSRLQGVLPNLLAAGRLAGNLYNNERVFGELIKGIRPDLKLSYLTHRQVVGDEATKQAYYRRAALGQTKAALPFTSDADRQMAYLMEAKRIGDELRAQGDLADNQEIRRTSDESNQHQWANILRNTEIANANVAAINYANALKHNLLALKHSANWTSWDNYLKGLEYRARQNYAEDKAFNDLLYAMQEENNLADDIEVMAALKKLGDILKENGNDYNDPKVIEASRELKKIMNRKSIEMYERIHNRKRENNLLFAKSGTKFTYKKKDDLLYKSTRDAVEHFRKMSKISSDALNRKRIKVESLAKHPKGSTRKYLLGGVAPFTVYTPVTLGGETGMSQTTTGSTSTKSSSSGKSTDTELLDLMKNLFKEVRGLPVDVNSVYSLFNDILNRNKLFGTEMSTNDISLMYLNAMLQLNNIKTSKEIYDKALANATLNDALGEIAVTGGGLYIVLDKTGNVSVTNNLQDIMDGNVTPLTNELLLWLRLYDPKFLLGKGDAIILNSINNGVGINKITDELNKLAGTLGSTDETIEGFSQVESNQIKQGMKILANGALDGDYTVTEHSKLLLMQKNMALSYILRALPKNYKAILDAHAAMRGTTTPDLIEMMLSSRISSTYSLTINTVSGKSNTNNNEDAVEKIKSNQLMLLIQGEGGVPRTWNLITKDSNIKMSVDGIEYSQLPKITEDMSLDKMLSESGIAGILDSKLGITFGDLNISPDLFKDIMYSNSGGMVVTLPCKIVNGHKEVNLGIKQTYEDAVKEVESKGISKNSEKYYKILGEVLKQKGLDSLLDSNGYPDKNKFGQFLVVEAYTTDKIKNLNKSSLYIEKVKNPDALLEDRMIKALSTDSKKSNYSLDIDYWLYGDDVYRGTVFIPLTNNLNAAINASGNLISVENARELENKFQNFNKASNMKSSNSDVL